jgi:hypothetical protein
VEVIFENWVWVKGESESTVFRLTPKLLDYTVLNCQTNTNKQIPIQAYCGLMAYHWQCRLFPCNVGDQPTYAPRTLPHPRVPCQ